MRVDKLTLAALAATLRLYRDPEQARRQIPLLHLLGVPEGELQRRADSLAKDIASLPGVREAAACRDAAYLGGGSVPAQETASWAVAVAAANVSLDDLAARLRQGTPAVVGRLQHDRLLLNLRSVFAAQDAACLKRCGWRSKAERARGAPRGSSAVRPPTLLLQRRFVALVDGVPVDHVPPGGDVVGAAVLVLQIVGVLPDVDAQDRRLAVPSDGLSWLGVLSTTELAALVDAQPGPAAAEARRRRPW